MPDLEKRVSDLEEFVSEIKQIVKLAKLILMAMGTSLGLDLIQFV